MGKREKRFFGAVIFVCAVGILIIVLLASNRGCYQQSIAEKPRLGQTMVVMSAGVLNTPELSCTYTIIADTDTARRYLILDNSGQLTVTPLELGVPEF